MTTLVGNEVLYVIGLDGAGRLAATTEQTTTGAIAALGGTGISGIINSASYAPSLQNAVTAAFTQTKPLLISNAATTTTTNIGGITVLPGSVLNAVTAGGNPGVNLILNNMILTGMIINETGAGSTAIQMNSNNVNNIILTNSIVNSLGYSYLHNDKVADGSICANNYFSAGYDGPNYNHPTVAASNITNIGNIIDCSEFGIAIAQVNSYNMIGNIIRSQTSTSTTNAALHIEDLNTGGIILGNHAMNCKGEGFSIQVPVPMKGTPGPATTGFNQYKFTGVTKSGHHGIVCVNDANGGVTQMGCIGSVVDGFDFGIIVSDTQHMFAEGTVVNNCNNAIFTAKHGRSFGRLSTSNTITLYTGQAGSVCDPVYSLTQPTAILTKSGGNLPGPVLRGWGYPVAFTHTGSGAELFTIAPMPSLFYGDIFIRIEGGGAAVGYVATIKWDGSSLTTPITKISILNTPITAFSIATAGGNLQASVTSASGFTQSFRIEFEGYWMQNS